MAETQRVDLTGPLAGRYVVVDLGEMTFGTLEDFQSGRAAAILDALARCIVGGNLPRGQDRAGLRRLKPAEIGAVIEGVGSAWELPKS